MLVSQFVAQFVPQLTYMMSCDINFATPAQLKRRETKKLRILKIILNFDICKNNK